jgi:hypothetical protein
MVITKIHTRRIRMKKMFVILALAAFLAGTSGFAFSANDEGGNAADPQQQGGDQVQQKIGEEQGSGEPTRGPAPCSGDGIPQGNPWDLNPDEDCPNWGY